MEPDTLTGLLKVVAAVVVGVPLMVFFLQERLIFMPQPLSEAALADIRLKFPKGQSVFGRASDGTRLHAWHLPGPPGAPLVLYFGGNAEDVSWMLGEADAAPTVGWLLVDYRGYGASEGSPSEAVPLSSTRRSSSSGSPRRSSSCTVRPFARRASLGCGKLQGEARPSRGGRCSAPGRASNGTAALGLAAPHARSAHDRAAKPACRAATRARAPARAPIMTRAGVAAPRCDGRWSDSARRRAERRCATSLGNARSPHRAGGRRG